MVNGVSLQVALAAREVLVQAVTQLVRQCHHIAEALGVVHQDVRMNARHRAATESAAPFAGTWLSVLDGTLLGIIRAPGLHWLAFKIAFFLFCFLWFRATFPRYRYDQIMRLGWKVFIPITIVWIVLEGAMAALRVGPWAV